MKTARDRARFTLRLLRELRQYPAIKKDFMDKIDYKNLLDAISKYPPYLEPENKDTVNDWVKSAEGDLVAYRLLYDKEAGLALYHLQQMVEKLTKANAIFLGINKEEELTKYSHDSAKFFVDFIESDIAEEILKNNPIKHPKFKTYISPSDLELLKNLSRARKSRNQKVTNKIIEMDQDLPQVITILTGASLIFSEEGRVELRKIWEKQVNRNKQLEKEIEKLIKKTGNEKLIDSAIIFTQYNAGLYYLLYPFAFITPAFEGAGRYPDEKKKMFKDIDYENLNLIKYADNIIMLFGKYIKTLKDYLALSYRNHRKKQ